MLKFWVKVIKSNQIVNRSDLSLTLKWLVLVTITRRKQGLSEAVSQSAEKISQEVQEPAHSTIGRQSQTLAKKSAMKVCTFIEKWLVKSEKIPLPDPENVLSSRLGFCRLLDSIHVYGYMVRFYILILNNDFQI